MSKSKTDMPKAWMRHDKTKNGYIVRMELDNGYKAYRPQWACCLHVGNRYWRGPDCAHRYWNRYGGNFDSSKSYSPEAEKMGHRQITLREDRPIDVRDLDLQDIEKQEGYQFARAEAGSPKMPKARPMIASDPIEEGRDMAADSMVPLPSDKSARFHTGVRVLSTDSEEKELEELRRQGLLYDEAEPSAEDLRLGDIWHEEPAYSIRQSKSTRRKGKGKSAAAGGGGAGLDEELGDFFIPEEAFESWAEFAEQSGFEFVLLDDLVSNADSWVELEDEEGGFRVVS